MLLHLIYIFIFLLLSSFCYSDDMDVLRQITMYEKVLLGTDRLTFAEYGEHATMDTNPNRYDEKVIEYNANGGIKRFQRRGLKDDNVYGKIDNLHIQLDGNRLQKVTDDALPLYRSGASDFVDGVDNDVEYIYNGAGALTSDANRGIANIEYDNLNHPQRVMFTNGNTIKYVYAADGTRLRTIHSQKKGSAVLKDSIDYHGNLILKNGMASMYLFAGGYISFKNNIPDACHYYIEDYQGNNRMVVGPDNKTEQVTHYYPYGGVIGGIARNAALQPYKFEGKELDRTYGLDWYDIHARQYDPIVPSWHTVDPLAEKYYDVSPYAYCGGDPVNAIDPDGKKIVIAAGVSSVFVQYYNLVINYLKENKCGQIIEQLENIDEIYTVIDGTNHGNYFDYTTNVISWMPLMGLNTIFTILSPSTLLNHEFDHALQYHTDPIRFKNDIMPLDDSDLHSDYHSKEEYRVINGSERRTAEALGEIETGEVTRLGHTGEHVETVSPISNNPVKKIKEFEIIGKKER